MESVGVESGRLLSPRNDPLTSEGLSSSDGSQEKSKGIKQRGECTWFCGPVWNTHPLCSHSPGCSHGNGRLRNAISPTRTPLGTLMLSLSHISLYLCVSYSFTRDVRENFHVLYHHRIFSPVCVSWCRLRSVL